MRVYILKSAKTGRYYCGQTADLANRFHRHNSGNNISTANGVPWELVWSVETHCRSDALKLEKKIKARGVARFLADIGST